MEAIRGAWRPRLLPAGALAATFIVGEEPPRSGWIYPDCARFTIETMKKAAEESGFRFRVLDWAHPRQTWALYSAPGFDTAWLDGKPLGWNTYARSRKA